MIKYKKKLIIRVTFKYVSIGNNYLLNLGIFIIYECFIFRMEFINECKQEISPDVETIVKNCKFTALYI